MNCINELSPWSMEVIALSTSLAFLWDPQWYACTGVTSVDFLADVRNLGGANLILKPAIQYAAVRTDRPGAGAVITAGSDITGAGAYSFKETLSGGTQFFFRRGIGYKLDTGGTFARAEVMVHTAFRSCGKVFPPREIVFNPLNSSADVSVFPLTGVFPVAGVSKAKCAVVGLDNANGAMDWRIFGRAFNDKLARGGWTPLGPSWYQPAAGDFTPVNTGEIDLGPLSLSSNHWVELAFAVQKGAGTDANSRCIFHVATALKYA